MPRAGALPAVLLAALVAGAQACSCGASDEPCDGQVCGGACVDPSTAYQADPNNCGGCGIRCGGAATCAGGLCQCGSLTRCDQLVPRCRDLQTDAGACGACSTSCAATKPGSACTGGACTCTVPSAPDDCGALCTNTGTDPANCGGCGNACLLAREICSSGTCACPVAYPDPCPTSTPTACVNLDTDPANCGACGSPCPLEHAICASRACACPAALPTACPAASPPACVDTTADPAHCGGCGAACPPGASCESSRCVCPSGTLLCGGACLPCVGGTCVDGACVCPAGPVAGCGGACCPGGTACCAETCPRPHSNGLGGSYFNCDPPYAPPETTLAAARAAADAWSAGLDLEGTTACGTYCLGRQTASQCAVWCYGISPLAGRVALSAQAQGNVCVCPTTASPTWN